SLIPTATSYRDSPPTRETLHGCGIEVTVTDGEGTPANTTRYSCVTAAVAVVKVPEPFTTDTVLPVLDHDPPPDLTQTCAAPETEGLTVAAKVNVVPTTPLDGPVKPTVGVTGSRKTVLVGCEGSESAYQPEPGGTKVTVPTPLTTVGVMGKV